MKTETHAEGIYGEREPTSYERCLRKGYERPLLRRRIGRYKGGN